LDIFVSALPGLAQSKKIDWKTMLRVLKQTVSEIPGVGRIAKQVYRAVSGKKGHVFTTSDEYWNARYELGGNSGSGSYSDLAQFKAEILNKFVRDHGIQSVIEYGCGDGAQLSLAEYPHYVGLDVSPLAVAQCQRLYGGDSSKEFYIIGGTQPSLVGDLTLSLDVIYHLVEDEVFNAYMESLLETSSQYVGIYASNDDRSSPVPHVRHRRFTSWIEKNRPAWKLIEFVKNKYPWDQNRQQETSFADFHFFEKS
jgi:SAM-dependent methyltransferase